MKGKRLAVLILSLLAPIATLAGQEADISSPKLRIAYADFKPLYDAKKVVVIDTRDVPAFNMGHIPGARVIPLDQIPDRIEELRRLQKPIVTYCS